MRRASFIVPGLVLHLAAPASAQPVHFCAAAPVHWCDGCMMRQDIVAPANNVCLLTLSPTGKFIGVTFPVRPKRGQAGVANNFTIAYRTTAVGGEDEFEYLVRFEASGVKQQMNVQVHVKIDPDAR